MAMKSLPEFLNHVRPYLAVVFIRFGQAGLVIISKYALNKGMSHYTCSVYRNLIATFVLAPFALLLERNTRPPMTLPILFKIILLSLLGPVIDQNLYYTGVKYVTATFASAIFNILPVITFLMAWMLRLEKVKLRRLDSQAKVVGTLVSLSGAMVMTFIKGPVIRLPWTKQSLNNSQIAATVHADQQNFIIGSLVCIADCFSAAIFFILQTITLKSYPALLSLTTLICMGGALQGTLLTFAIERDNTAIWSIHWDVKLLAYVYAGLICTTVGYFLQGAVMKEKGLVFLTSFSPLSMVIVAVISSFVLAEQLDCGKVTGATVIVVGLYLVLWGKSREEKISSVDLMHKEEETKGVNPCINVSKDDSPQMVDA